MATLNDYLTIVSSAIPTYNTLDTNLVITQVNLARNRVAGWGACTRTIANFTLTAGTNTYSFATLFPNNKVMGIQKIYVWLGNTKYAIERMPMDAYSFVYLGYPVAYWQTGNSITFYPTPSQNFPVDIVYTYLPLQLQYPTDVDNDIQDVYAQAVGYEAAAYTALIDNNVQLSQIYEQKAMQIFAEVNKQRV
jgi:hypothetical protein